MSLYRWDIGHDFGGHELFGLRLGHHLSSALPSTESGGIIYESDTGRIRWHNGTALQTLYPATDTLAQNTIPVRGASGQIKQYLPNGQLFVGNGSNEASATAKSAIPISGFGAATAHVDLGTPGSERRIRNLANPEDATDAVNLQTMFSYVGVGIRLRDAVRVATTVNITLSGIQTIDGIPLLAGDRVLVKNQSTESQNGYYVVAAGAWVRSTDMNTWDEVPGSYAPVDEGDTQGGTGWKCVSEPGGTLGTTAIEFKKFVPVTRETAGNGMVKVGTALSFAQSSNYTTGSLFYASGATTIALLAPGTTGRPLLAGASGPSYGQLALGGGHVSGQLPVASGGTGASTESVARSNLGLAIGSNVQAWSSQLDGLAALNTNGYARRAAGSWAITSTVPTSDLSGVLQAAQMPELGGDLLGSAGSLSVVARWITSLAFDNANVHIGFNGASDRKLVPIHTESGTNYPDSLTVGAGLMVSRNTSPSIQGPGTFALFKGAVDAERFYFRSKLATNNWGAWRRIWHAGDQGSGSGMDADMVDGQHASAFQAASGLLNAMAGIGSNGIVVRTGASSATSRAFAVSGDGLSVSNDDGVSGNPTVSLAHDLAALEALSGAGYARRTGANTWTTDAVVTSARGGTGFTTYDNGDILMGAGGSLSRVAPGLAGYALISNGPSSSLSWQELALSSSLFTGLLPLNRGGTGKGSWVAGRIPFAGASAFNEDGALFWDNTNKRLGVGTATPQAAAHVAGGARLDGQLALHTSPGTAPITLTSTSRTLVGNLNVDQLDGADVGEFEPVGGVHLPPALAGSNRKILSTLTGVTIGSGDFVSWIRFRVPTANPSATMGLIKIGASENAHSVSQFDAGLFTDGTIRFRLTGDASASDFVGGQVASFVTNYAGRVVDVVVRRAAGAFSLFVDGVTVAYSAFNGGTPPAVGTVVDSTYQVVGLRGTNEYFFGDFYRAVLFNTALTDAEIQGLTTRGIESGARAAAPLINLDDDLSSTAGWSASFGAYTMTTPGAFTRLTVDASWVDNFGLAMQSLSGGDAVPGHRYRIRFEARRHAGSPNMVVSMSGNSAGAGGATAVLTSDWAEYEHVVTCQPTTASKLRLRITNTTAGSGDAVDVRNVLVTSLGAVVDLDLGVGFGSTIPDRGALQFNGVVNGALEHILPVNRSYPKIFSSETLGGGSGTSFDVTHNLGTKAVIAQVYHKTLDDLRGVGIRALNTTQVRVSFGASQTGSDYRIVVCAV